MSKIQWRASLCLSVSVAVVVAVGFVITIYFTMKFIHSIRDPAYAEDDADPGGPLIKNPV